MASYSSMQTMNNTWLLTGWEHGYEHDATWAQPYMAENVMYVNTRPVNAAPDSHISI